MKLPLRKQNSDWKLLLSRGLGLNRLRWLCYLCSCVLCLHFFILGYGQNPQNDNPHFTFAINTITVWKLIPTKL